MDKLIEKTTYARLADKERIEPYLDETQGSNSYNAGLMLMDGLYLLIQGGCTDEYIRAYINKCMDTIRRDHGYSLDA